MKKIISIMLSIMLTSMCMLSGFVPASAADTPPDGATVITAGQALEVSATKYSAKDSQANLVVDSKNAMFNTSASRWIEYEVWATAESVYTFYLKYGTTGNSPVKLTLNGTAVGSTVTLTATGGYATFKRGDVATIRLNAGKNTIRLTSTGYKWVNALGFEPYADIAVSGVTTNLSENVLTATEGIARGTDSFEITFNNNHKKDTAEAAGAVVLKDGDAAVPAEVTSDGTKITVKLKKTLDYSKNYKLVLNGIDDTAGISSIINREIPFTTKATDLGTESATISITDKVIDVDTITLTTKTMSSAGVAMEGRTITVTLKKPDGSLWAETICTGTSGADGISVIEATIPAALTATTSGVYTWLVACEYATSAAESTMPFFTEGDKGQFLIDIETAKTQADPATAVKGVYSAKETLLGIDITTDTAGLTNADKVFAHIANDAPTTGEEIITKYEKYIAMETINQATATAPIEGVLNSEKLCGYLGFSFNKLELISNEKDTLLLNILDLGEIQDSAQFKQAVNKLIEEAYAKEYSITAVDVVLSNLSCYVGQAPSQVITLTDAADSVTSIKLLISADDAAILEELEMEAQEPLAATIQNADGKKEILFALDAATDGIESLGTIKFKNTATTKTYNLTIDGEMTYDVGQEYDAKTFFTQKAITVTVQANSQSGESTPTTRPTVTPSKPTGTGTVVHTPPVETEEPKDDPKEEDPKEEEPKEEYNFSDLANFDWAKEAISELVEMGVISKSEDNQFNPSKNVTRAEFVKMIIVAFGLEEEGLKADFADIADDAWYNTYAAAAQKHGIVTGDAEGRFNGDENITRQDMAVIIKRAFEKKGLKIENVSGEAFSDDSNIAEYAKEAVYMMKSANIINGMGENTFAPKDNATRAQAAKVIYETVKAVIGE